MASAKCTAILLGILAVICSCTDAQYFYLTASRHPPGDIQEGSDVTFTCEIRYPGIEVWIEWQYVHNLWTSESSTSLTKPILVTGSHSLTLRGVSVDQMGYYRCAGNNYWLQGYWSPDRTSSWSPLPLVTYRPFIISENRTWIGANDNDTATLSCYLQSKPRPDITWYGPNGANITDNSDPDRFFWENQYENMYGGIGYKTTSTLTIKQVNTTTDYGMYMCRAYNSIGSHVDHEIELKEPGAPEAPRALETTHVDENTIEVHWDPGYDGGEASEYFHVNIREISEDFNASSWISRAWLQFGQWEYSDLQPDTVYQVAVYATNQLGPSPYATLDVRTAPASPNDLGIAVSYTRSSGILVVKGIPTGDDTGTSCLRFEGKEQYYSWYPLGQDLYCIERDGVFEYLGPYSDNMRCYYCRDSLCSSYSYVGYDWELSVSKTPWGPVLEGSDVSLVCSFTSPLTGWIEWRYSQDRLWSTTLTEPTFVDSDNTLTLSGLFRNRTGWYRCAGNTVGPSDGDWNANRLSIWTAVQAIYGPDIINKDRTWIGANQNYTATLECVIQGNPLPSVSWYGVDDAPLSDDTTPDRISLEDIISGDEVIGFEVVSHVIFDSVDVSTDYGTYRCKATSSIGGRPTFDEHDILLKETGTPEPPQLRAEYVYEDGISVGWDFGYDGGEELEYQFINYRKIPEQFNPHWIRFTRYTSYWSLSYLQYDTVYQIAVYATNRLGSSPHATVTARTTPGIPSEIGISVMFFNAKCKFVVTGTPQDDDPATCLKIGRDFHDWVSLGPDLDCIQSDGEFKYCSEFTSYFYSRYCRDDVCSSSSYIELDSSPPDPNGPQISTALIVCMCVFGSLVLVLLTLGVRKRCTAKASPPGAARANGSQINPSSEVGVYTPTLDAPPTYMQAVESDFNPNKNEEEPPPGYHTVLPQGTPHATSNENEDQV